MAEIDNTQGTLDVRDIIARYENLVASIEYFEEMQRPADEEELVERDQLLDLLDDLRGNGGDEQWQGDWYPVTLIRDSYFRTYAELFAEDIGAISTDTYGHWPFNCIDWEKAAAELQMDYTPTEFNGVTYWYR